MKLYIKLMVGIVGLASIARTLLAAEATSGYTSYATNARPTLNYSNSIAISSSNAVMVAMNAQALLLKEMIQEHQKRVADLTEKSQGEKAKWESDLVNELQERSARIQKSTDQANQPRPGGEVDYQLVFISTLESHLERVHQELLAAIEDGRILSTQIATNKAPEEIGSMSFVLGENQKMVNELRREQLDLELRKLEFRAILKAVQK